MALLARLISYASAAFGPARAGKTPDAGGEADERLAATALLVHVARADGILDPAEAERLVRLVRSHFTASEAEAQELLARASAFDAETRDMASLVELIGREGVSEERERILAMAWSVAGADGEVHEFEEALVWRLGKLLGLDEDAIARARDGARMAAEATGDLAVKGCEPTPGGPAGA